MIPNPNALIVPGLPSRVHLGSEVAQIAHLMEASGIQPLTLNTPLSHDPAFRTSEYSGDMKPTARRNMEDYAEAQRVKIAQSTIVVIANALEEPIEVRPGGEPICKVPFSVGRIAATVIRVANDVYGSNSGRVFLSQGYPDLTELFSLTSNQGAVVKARARLLELYPLRPVALRGDYKRMIEVAKTSREGSTT